jgi:hypothetical protein
VAGVGAIGSDLQLKLLYSILRSSQQFAYECGRFLFETPNPFILRFRFVSKKPNLFILKWNADSSKP